VAAAAMIIPGVSGAMVLILFGLFPLAMHTISLIREYLMTPFDFSLLPPILMVVIPIGLGVVAGILLMSRLIAMLLEKHHSITYFAIMGLIFGTIFAIFNDDSTYQSYNNITPLLVVYALVAFAIGMAISLRLGKKN
jgi:putative membrane protein